MNIPIILPLSSILLKNELNKISYWNRVQIQVVFMISSVLWSFDFFYICRQDGKIKILNYLSRLIIDVLNIQLDNTLVGNIILLNLNLLKNNS